VAITEFDPELPLFVIVPVLLDPAPPAPTVTVYVDVASKEVVPVNNPPAPPPPA
jgi:hypothetical protein